MSSTFFYITAVLYFVATFVYVGYLVTHRDKVLDAGRYIFYAGFAAHTVAFAGRWLMAGRTPATTFHESLTLFAWMTVLIYLVLQKKYKLSVLGAFVAPFALLLLITASLMPKEVVPLPPILESYWLPFHIFIAFLGNAFFALACFLGVMYLIQNRYLKEHKLGGLYFLLPSLEVIDELGYRCLTYGFPLMTLAMITGAVWSEYTIGTYWKWEHRQVWSLITWFLYAALLHGRITSGWRGRKAAVLSVVAFCTVVSSYFIINILSGGAHGYAR